MITSGRSHSSTREALFSAARLFDFDRDSKLDKTDQESKSDRRAERGGSQWASVIGATDLRCNQGAVTSIPSVQILFSDAWWKYPCALLPKLRSSRSNQRVMTFADFGAWNSRRSGDVVLMLPCWHWDASYWCAVSPTANLTFSIVVVLFVIKKIFTWTIKFNQSKFFCHVWLKHLNKKNIYIYIYIHQNKMASL